jgi:hypothetical protein
MYISKGIGLEKIFNILLEKYSNQLIIRTLH